MLVSSSQLITLEGCRLEMMFVWDGVFRARVGEAGVGMGGDGGGGGRRWGHYQGPPTFLPSTILITSGYNVGTGH